MLETLATTARELIGGADQVHLIEVSQDAAVGHARVRAHDDDARRDDSYVQVMDGRPSGSAHVVQTGELLTVADARGADAGRLRADYVERFDVASACFVPLAWGGEVRHVMVLISHVPHAYGSEETELAATLANVAAAGLALREAGRTQAARHDHDAALSRAARALTEHDDLEAVLQVLATEACLALGGDMSGVYLGDGEQGGMATAGHNTPPGWAGYLMRPGEGVAGQVLATGVAAIANAYQSDVRLPENTGLRRLQTAVAVPMTWDGRLRGALSIGFIAMRRVGPSDLRTVQAIADLASVACELRASGP